MVIPFQMWALLIFPSVSIDSLMGSGMREACITITIVNVPQQAKLLPRVQIISSDDNEVANVDPLPMFTIFVFVISIVIVVVLVILVIQMALC